MASDAATIAIKLVAKIDQLQVQMNKARTIAEQTAQGMVQPMQQANKKVTESITRSATEVARFGQVTGGQRAFIQNFGDQISDMAVQIGGGTSVLRAMGQQIPQMLGPLGVFGAILGTVVAVGVPLIQVFAGSAKQAKSLSDQVTDLGKSVSEYLQFADQAALPTAELAKKYGTAAESARTFLAALRDIDAIKVGDQLKEISKTIGDSFGNMEGQSLGSLTGLENSLNYVQKRSLEIANQLDAGTVTDPNKLDAMNIEQADLDNALQKMTGFRQMTENAAIAMKLTRDQAAELLGRMADLQNARGLENQTTAAKALTDAIHAAYPDLDKMPPAMRSLYDAIGQAGNSMAELLGHVGTTTSGLNAAASSADALGGALQTALGFAASLEAAINGMNFDNIGKAAELAALQAGQSPKQAKSAGDIASKRAQLAPMLSSRESDVRAQAQRDLSEFSGSSQQGATYDEAIAAANRKWEKAHGTSGKSGGGKVEKAYDHLMSSLDPVIAAQNELEKSTKEVNAAFAAGNITLAEKAHALEIVNARFQEATLAAKNGIDIWATFEVSGANAIDKLISGTGSLKSVLRDMIKELELAMVKQALLGSIKGATADMSIGGMLMTGLGSLLGFRANGGPVQAGRPYVVGERQAELFVPNVSGTIMPSIGSMLQPRSIQAPGGGGAQVLHVQISTDSDYVTATAHKAGASAALPIAVEVTKQAFKVADRKQRAS